MRRLVMTLLTALLVVTSGCSGEGTPPHGGVPNVVEPSDDPAAVSDPSHHPGQKTSPQSSEPGAPEGVSEAVLSPLRFHPDIIAVISSGRGMAELQAASLNQEGFEALTAGRFSPKLPLGVVDVAVFDDGSYLAYTRTNGYEGTKAICVRPVAGGVPVCSWGNWGDVSLSWRPGTRDVWVLRSSPYESPVVLTLSDGRLISSDSPLDTPVGELAFSPDGKSVLYRQRSTTSVLQLPPVVSQPITLPGWAEWIDNRRIAVVVDETQVKLLDTAGRELEVARVPLKAPELIKKLRVSPGGRFLVANFGRFRNALFRYEGSAVLDLQSGAWTRVPLVEGWAGDDMRAVVQTGAGLSLFYLDGRPELTSGQKWEGEYLGTSRDGKWILLDSDEGLQAYQVDTAAVRTFAVEKGKLMRVMWVP